MSLDSIKDAEKELLKRYKKTWGQKHPEFLAGKGVSWKRLKDDFDKEAAAEKTEKNVQFTAPWSSAEAAGLLGLNQKVFRALATMDSKTGSLIVGEGKHVSIRLCRLLEWAEGMTDAAKVRRWRESRNDEDLLGKTTPSSPAAAFRIVKNVRIEFGLIEGKVTSLDLSHLSDAERAKITEILRGGRGAIQHDERGLAMLTPVASTLPEAFRMQWTDEALKSEYVERYQGLLESAQDELALHLERVKEDIRDAGSDEEGSPGALALAALLDMWKDEERDVQELHSEVRAELLDISLPPAVPTTRTPFRF